jgi:hypothetical protein
MLISVGTPISQKKSFSSEGVGLEMSPYCVDLMRNAMIPFCSVLSPSMHMSEQSIKVGHVYCFPSSSPSCGCQNTALKEAMITVFCCHSSYFLLAQYSHAFHTLSLNKPRESSETL